MKRSLLLTAALLVVVPDIVSAQATRDMPHGDRRPPQGRPDQGRPGGGGRPDRPSPGGPTTRPTPPYVRPVHPGEALERRSRVVDAYVREGGSGHLTFIVIETEIRRAGADT